MAHLSIVVAESYALKELPETEMRRVEKHVASCQRCADLVGEQLVWVAQMRSPFRRKVEKMIEAEQKKAAKRLKRVERVGAGKIHREAGECDRERVSRPNSPTKPHERTPLMPSELLLFLLPRVVPDA